MPVPPTNSVFVWGDSYQFLNRQDACSTDQFGICLGRFISIFEQARCLFHRPIRYLFGEIHINF
ncbi:hypothetical protein [Tychonema bourrellyi]|uniref:hypothetical protein n=1 Tax=Tychonema bourrellyi TaxID=54313 RepID=UPI00117EEA65|nr:hypothetical protein [Tychonema bourrellyi]